MNTRWSLTLPLCAALLLGACAAQPTPPQPGADGAAAPTGTGPGPSLDNLPTYLSLVRQMQGNGLWFASLAHIDALEQKWGASPDSRLLKAEALRQTAQWSASRRLYEQLLDTPVRGAAYRGLGLIAGSQEDFPRAILMLEKARQLLPTDGLVLNDLGYAYLLAQRFEEARLPLMQASELLPSHPRVASNVALYHLSTGQPEHARRLMAQRALSPATRQAIEQLALVLRPGVSQPAPSSSLVLKSAQRLSQASLAEAQATQPQ